MNDWQKDPELLAMARARERWHAWLNSIEGRAELAKLKRRHYRDCLETAGWIVLGAITALVAIVCMAW